MIMRLCFASALLTVLVIFAIMDGIWLGLLQKGAYQKQFEEIQGSPLQVKIGGAVWSYLAMTAIILIFIVPRVSSENLVKEALLYGALLGFFVYSIYNGTNYATLNNYHLSTAIKDTLWGTILFAIAALGATYAAHNWIIFTPLEI